MQSCTFSSTANSTLVVLVFHVGAEEEQLRMFEEDSKRVSFCACACVGVGAYRSV